MENDIPVHSCIDCAASKCGGTDGGYADFCLTANMDEALLAEAMAAYAPGSEERRLACAAAEVEAENYCRMTRVEETMEFARKIGAKKIGIATCVGLLYEARMAARIFRSHGFTVYGAACKAGAQAKTSIGIDPACEAVGVNMCNPVLQAKLLNSAGTDLNVVIGLCVGHDSLFYRHSAAPVTTLIAKDRVLAHNPVGALYQADKYYKKLLGK